MSDNKTPLKSFKVTHPRSRTDCTDHRRLTCLVELLLVTLDVNDTQSQSFYRASPAHVIGPLVSRVDNLELTY